MSQAFWFCHWITIRCLTLCDSTRANYGELPAYKVISALVNIFRAIPFIILLVWMIPFTRMVVGTSIGLQAAIVPLTVGAAPFIARMVENTLLEIPHGLIEASRAMGATPMQIIKKVLLPESLPGLINAATITLITLVGYSAMGALWVPVV